VLGISEPGLVSLPGLSDEEDETDEKQEAGDS
jgi:hypothetical protein